MKKSIIAAGAASVALAAMPIVGAMATDLPASVIDNIEVVISDGCTITRADEPAGGEVADFERDASITIAAGEKDSDDTPAFTITCSKIGWTVSAEGTGTAGTSLTDGESTPNLIATGTTLSGATSEWAMKVALSGATASNSFTSDHVVPASSAAAADKLVATGTATTGSVTPTYTVFAAADQVAGTYTGQVTYTVVLP